MASITPSQVLTIINKTQKLIETTPAVVGAVKHIVDNGIKQGGYDIVVSAWNGMTQTYGGAFGAAKYVLTAEGGYQQGLKELGSSAFYGVKNTFGNQPINFSAESARKFMVNKKSISLSGNSLKATQNELSNTLNTAPEIEAVATSGTNIVQSSVSAVGQAGVAGIVIGITTETLISYEAYKGGHITKEEYLTEVAKAGCEGGLTAAATAGIMVPVTAALSTTGLVAAPVTIPVSIILSAGINKIIAPMFGRGDYKKILGEARYYQNLMDMQNDLVSAIEMAEKQFVLLIDEYQKQSEEHEMLNQANNYLSQQHMIADNIIHQQSVQLNNTFSTLSDLYNKI